jgi:hypothetical protein
MRTRLTAELHEVFRVAPGSAPQLCFSSPPEPRSAVAQRRLQAFIGAPAPSTLKDVRAVAQALQDVLAQPEQGGTTAACATALLQVTSNALTRMACVFDDVALEVLKLLDENVAVSLPQSDVGKRLVLVRFRKRTMGRRRRQSLVLHRQGSSDAGSGAGSTLLHISASGKRKSTSSGSGTGSSSIAPPLPPV